MKPTIALTTYGRYEKDLATAYHKYLFSIPAPYVDAIRRAGGIPLLLPPGEDDWAAVLAAVDGIVVTGGVDVSPAEYHGDSTHSQLTRLDPERDQSELSLIRNLINGDGRHPPQPPTLCVCRGTQVLNIALGGSLYEHVDEIIPQQIHRGENGGWSTHAVEVMPTSLLAQVMDATTVVTYSGHHQAIKELAPGLKISAQAPDGIIEAIEYESLPWLLGVQWHPEVSADRDPTQQRLFDALVQEARLYKERNKR